MMRLERPTLALILLLACQPACADDMAKGCTGHVLFPEAELRRTLCSASAGVLIERYVGTKQTSPYATALDQREMVVVHGNDPTSVKAAASIDANPHRPPAASPLLSLPLEDQISRQSKPRIARTYRRWHVSTFQVEYATQGGFPGFFLVCATATRSSAEATAVVAECFAPEERARFYGTLDSMR
jgi:hypothetical protein